jgi:hypothetical protein
MAKDEAGGLSALIRKAGKEAKQRVEAVLDQNVGQDDVIVRPKQPRIFNIIEYIESDWGLGMTLYPVQRFIVKLYYHIPLDDTTKTIEIKDMLATHVKYQFTEVEYLKYLYSEGRCNIAEQDHERRELILPIGRRGGKTTLAGIFASYEVYRLLNLHHPQSYYGLPSGNRIQIISVATDKDQAGLLFNEVTSHLARCDYFKPYIASNTLSDIKFRTPHDIEKFGTSYRTAGGRYESLNGKATIRVTFKSCIAKGLRGAGNIVMILDEMAHFIDEGQSSAKDIYDAISPSKAAFSPKDPEDSTKPIGPNEGRIICISSPLNKSGKFYELFQTAMKGGDGAYNKLAIQMPTWEINPTVSSDYYREKYYEDPTTFETEHGARFSDRVRAWIEREKDLIDCVDPVRRPIMVGFPKYPHQLGLDIGIGSAAGDRDGTAVAITYPLDGKIVLAYHEYWRAGYDWKELNPHLTDYSCDYARRMQDEDRLDFDEILEWLIGLTKRFHITDGLYDRWQGMSMEQDFIKRGYGHIKCEFFTRDTTSKMYQTVKSFMLDHKLVLYDYPIPGAGSQSKHSPLISELLTLQAEQVSRNIVIVGAPEKSGYHDDQADALVRAVWLTADKMSNLKHTYKGLEQTRNPTGPSLQGYHMSRMRKHGVFTERMSPRAGISRGFRGRMR